jgi:hypothetical protein
MWFGTFRLRRCNCRKHFPVHMKSHRSHDIVLLCIDCHERAHTSAERLKLELSERFDVPLQATLSAHTSPSTEILQRSAYGPGTRRLRDPDKGTTSASDECLESSPENDVEEPETDTSSLSHLDVRKAAVTLDRQRNLPTDRRWQLESIIYECAFSLRAINYLNRSKTCYFVAHQM